MKASADRADDPRDEASHVTRRQQPTVSTESLDELFHCDNLLIYELCCDPLTERREREHKARVLKLEQCNVIAAGLRNRLHRWRECSRPRSLCYFCAASMHKYNSPSFD